MIGVFGARWGRAAAEAPRRFCLSSRASVGVESVLCLCFAAVIAAGAFQVLNMLFIGDVLDRAARAVARDSSLQIQAAADKAQLLARAGDAIRKEFNDWIDPGLVKIDIKVYDNPSAMLRGEESSGDNSQLGGDAGDMVVVRLRYAPAVLAGLRKMLQAGDFDPLAFQAVAVARNERTAGLPAL